MRGIIWAGVGSAGFLGAKPRISRSGAQKCPKAPHTWSPGGSGLLQHPADLILVGILVLLFGVQADIANKHRQLTQMVLYRLRKFELRMFDEKA